jgi:phosphate transport system permease protein
LKTRTDTEQQRRKGIALRDSFHILLWLAAVAVPLISLLLVFELIQGSIDSLTTFGFRFLVGTDWVPNPPEGRPPSLGALPMIYGSIVTTIIALLLAAPLGLGVALFQSELAPKFLREPSVFLSEMLASVPSVVYGLWGLLVLVPFMRDYVDPVLQRTLGFVPLFSGPASGLGMLTAGVILAIMVIPYASSLMREVVAAVPRSQREAALSLGATNWETVRTAILPYAKTGVVAALVLAMGRAIGETMAVTMVIGNVSRISPSLFLPAYTIPSIMANEFTEVAGNQLYLSALFELGLVLFAIAFIMNLIGRLLIGKLTVKRKGMAHV